VEEGVRGERIASLPRWLTQGKTKAHKIITINLFYTSTYYKSLVLYDGGVAAIVNNLAMDRNSFLS
jgi:hypothetical protein